MKPIRLPSERSIHAFTGIPSQGQGLFIAEQIARIKEEWVWIFLPDLRNWESLSAEIDCFLTLDGSEPSIEHFHFPPIQEQRAAEAISNRQVEAQLDRIALLSALTNKETPSKKTLRIVYTTIDAFFTQVQSPQRLSLDSIELKAGSLYPFSKLRDQLVKQLDYDAEAICEYPGQFSIRGGILDIYPVNYHEPVRIDFFGDEIEAIRGFDPTSQRSHQDIPSITIAPRTTKTTNQNLTHSLTEYLGQPAHFIWVEPEKLYAETPTPFLALENTPIASSNFTALFHRKKATEDTYTLISALDTGTIAFSEYPKVEDWNIHSLDHYRHQPLTHGVGAERVALEELARNDFFETLNRWAKEKTVLLLASSNEAENNRMLELISEYDSKLAKHIRLTKGSIRQGIRIDLEKGQQLSSLKSKQAKALVILTEHEVLGRRTAHLKDNAHTRRRKVPLVNSINQLLDFSELADGDYLVHLAHGICIFRGLATMDLSGRDEEVISLEFADSITLHLPLYESHLLTRYVGLSKTPPKLGKIGSGIFEKSRRSAEKATLDYAGKLLSLQATREKGEGHAFPPDTVWQRNFEAAFPHRETTDQLAAIENTKRDMEQPRPMDRLICGDVGFGKTEIAIRAAFKAVMDNRQVAILVPTTVLAQQHFNTFRDRMADYPITVEMVSRFRTPKQQKEIIRQVKKGSIDLLIGTHRILSKDIHFRDLGLLIIDEEHRFGVRHKERIKEMRTHVDVITMSATPIPRTLYLALMGARDLSTIDTPPANRKPIETIVRRYDDELVRKAIRYELDRGGQVFYLHNRVQTIHAVAQKLEELVPDARIAIGHGQMPEEALEKIMTQFVAGEFDILVCTTIIENGIDIPNSNTIIIEGADRFGLSQLYQLRGRVGRFNRQAYAYLLLHRHTRLLNQAHERLTAMRQYNQLGAGFKIAMRDLELRGAGNLLGAEQSGHVANIGFELYCQLLRQSVSRLKGEPIARNIRANISIDFVTLGESSLPIHTTTSQTHYGFEALRESEIEGTRIAGITAFIPREYLTEPQLRIDFYRRLALAEKTTEVEAIEQEMIDRFGTLPQPASVLIQITRMRTIAQESRLVSVVTEGNRLKCLRATGKQNDFLKIGSRFPRLTAQKPLVRLREIEQFLLRHRPK